MDAAIEREPGSARPRVLIVIDWLTELGGAEGSTALIIDGLQGTIGFAVLTLHGLDLRGHAGLERRGVEFFESGQGFARQARSLREAVRSFQPDLIHACLYDSELVSCLVGPLCGVPVVRSLVSTPYSAEAQAAARSPVKLRAVQMLDRFLARHATFRFRTRSLQPRRAPLSSRSACDQNESRSYRGGVISRLSVRTLPSDGGRPARPWASTCRRRCC